MSLAAWILAIAAVTAVLSFVVFGGRALVALTRPGDVTHQPGAHVLRYHLVSGQDGPSVVGAVRRAGYHASTEYDMGQVDLVVLCTGDPALERERVREAIATAPDIGGTTRDFDIPPVKFVDEA